MRQMLVTTSRALTNLERLALLIPSTDLFIAMYVRKEALLSSQIEGTQCTLEDVLDPELDTAANLDAGEVVNYVRAAQFALERMQQLPLCNRLLRETHAVLMEGVRGEEKNSRRISPQSKLDRPRRLWPQRCALHSAKCR